MPQHKTLYHNFLENPKKILSDFQSASKHLSAEAPEGERESEREYSPAEVVVFPVVVRQTYAHGTVLGVRMANSQVLTKLLGFARRM